MSSSVLIPLGGQNLRQKEARAGEGVPDARLGTCAWGGTAQERLSTWGRTRTSISRLVFDNPRRTVREDKRCRRCRALPLSYPGEKHEQEVPPEWAQENLPPLAREGRPMWLAVTRSCQPVQTEEGTRKPLEGVYLSRITLMHSVPSVDWAGIEPATHGALLITLHCSPCGQETRSVLFTRCSTVELPVEVEETSCRVRSVHAIRLSPGSR